MVDQAIGTLEQYDLEIKGVRKGRGSWIINCKEGEFVLKEYNGKIGVYENESLIYTLDIYVFTLPEVDKQLLKDGIIVSTKEKLYELIEEYY